MRARASGDRDLLVLHDACDYRYCRRSTTPPFALPSLTVQHAVHPQAGHADLPHADAEPPELPAPPPPFVGSLRPAQARYFPPRHGRGFMVPVPVPPAAPPPPQHAGNAIRAQRAAAMAATMAQRRGRVTGPPGVLKPLCRLGSWPDGTAGSASRRRGWHACLPCWAEPGWGCAGWPRRPRLRRQVLQLDVQLDDQFQGVSGRRPGASA
jgi:hypothetical protein